jgi:hypothetical protein
MAAESIRLLLCHACHSLEEMPDYEGNPDHDDVLSTLVSRHIKKHKTQEYSGQLMKVASKDWDSPTIRAGIEKAIKESTGYTGLSPEYYVAGILSKMMPSSAGRSTAALKIVETITRRKCCYSPAPRLSVKPKVFPNIGLLLTCARHARFIPS